MPDPAIHAAPSTRRKDSTRRRLRRAVGRAALAATLSLLGAASAFDRPDALRDAWSADDLATLASMRLEAAEAHPADPSNAYQSDARAARLGQDLFEDPRLSRDGRVSCASCHVPDRQYADGRPLAQGLATGVRRTMPVMGAARAPFLFWDGRKDSLWAQALGPLEAAAEHGGNRTRLAHVIRDHHAAAYERVFGPLPDLGAAIDASPLGSDGERAAWAALEPGARDRINRVFANIGKAIAAHESRIAYGPSRLDAYLRATVAGDGSGQAVLSPQEVRGLRLFLGKGQCGTCHRGPLLTDASFHNTGVPPRDPAHADRGRADAIRALTSDEFNCAGRYSDARPGQCGELDYLVDDDAAQLGAFRTPSLRNVAERAPYMHAGQFASLRDVVEHYARSPRAVVGNSELARQEDRRPQRRVIQLSARDVEDLVAFLQTLTGPVAIVR